jgi:hypothetical protein
LLQIHPFFGSYLRWRVNPCAASDGGIWSRRAATIPPRFLHVQHCFLVTAASLTYSQPSKGRFMTSNIFWINCYNVVKFSEICLLLCIFLDCWTLLIWFDVLLILRWFEYLCWIMSLFLDCDCFSDIKYWYMIHVWVYVVLFELICDLNKVYEINKIFVDLWRCSVLSWWMIICFELISWLK